MHNSIQRRDPGAHASGPRFVGMYRTFPTTVARYMASPMAEVRPKRAGNTFSTLDGDRIVRLILDLGRNLVRTNIVEGSPTGFAQASGEAAERRSS